VQVRSLVRNWVRCKLKKWDSRRIRWISWSGLASFAVYNVQVEKLVLFIDDSILTSWHFPLFSSSLNWQDWKTDIFYNHKKSCPMVGRFFRRIEDASKIWYGLIKLCKSTSFTSLQLNMFGLILWLFNTFST
jgi:hypothetical protein